MLPILEKLAQTDESVVRDRAVESLIIIGNEMADIDANSFLNTFLLLVLRLAGNSESYQARVSAIKLITTLYKKCGS